MIKVQKITLVLITGIIWTVVGILLSKKALFWYFDFTQTQAIISLLASFVFAFVKIKFVFIKAVYINIKRIMNMKTLKVSVFAFHTFKFYLLILLMISFGTLLRNLEFIPKYVIFPIYSGVGFSMFYGSYLYYLYFFRNRKG